MIDLDTCPCSGKTLAKLIKPAVLMLLVEHDLHGYDIVSKLGHLALLEEHKPDSTGVYRALRAMDESGLVASSWVLSSAGPAKRCYRITDDGLACLQRWLGTLRTYHAAVGALLAMAEKAVKASAPDAVASSACCPSEANGR